MKVLTGLDWLDVDIHHPKNLIDTCLSSSIPDEGCDVVDLVYVLYRCSEATDYKKDEIIKFYKLILDKINDNYFPKVGGFSYFKESSQSHYYGVKISDSLNQPIYMETLLFVWAIIMISQTYSSSNISLENYKALVFLIILFFKVLKNLITFKYFLNTNLLILKK